MHTGLDLTIAGTRLHFRAAEGLSVAGSGFEYPDFLGEHDFDRSLRIDVSIADPGRPTTAARVLFDTADGWLLTQHENTRCVRMPVRSSDGRYGDRDLWRLSWQAPLRRAHAEVHRDLVTRGVVRHLVQYPLDQIMLTTLLAAEGALLVHASGGMTSAGGVAFAGVSGAGKSTLTRLLADTAQARFFSDDRLFIRRDAGTVVSAPKPGEDLRPDENRAADKVRFRLHGTPWAGDAGTARNEHAPLHALCFLTQASDTSLRELQPAQALQRLLPVTTLPWFDAEAIGHALDACAVLIASVPCYELLFRPDRKAVEGVLRELHEERRNG